MFSRLKIDAFELFTPKTVQKMTNQQKTSKFSKKYIFLKSINDNLTFLNLSRQNLSKDIKLRPEQRFGIYQKVGFNEKYESLDFDALITTAIVSI